MPKSNKPKAKTKEIYLDFSASFEPNPSSIHDAGLKAKKVLDEDRQTVASFLHAQPSEIIFTSGGTEANNLAISGLVRALAKPGFVPHVVTTNIEHSSVLETVKALAKQKIITATFVPVAADGIVAPQDIKKAINPNTVLVSVMYANNEIGTIQPISEIAKAIRHTVKVSGQPRVYFHTDAVQAVHFLPLHIEKLGVDLLTLSGTKIKDARGAGVLYKNRQVVLEPIMYGGEQEFSLRPGTENTKSIMALAKGLNIISQRTEKEKNKLADLRDYFLKQVNNKKIFKECGILVNGSVEHRLPNNINVTFPTIPSDLLVIELSARGVMSSSKSACRSSQDEGSYVISAIRPDIGKDIGGLRLSLSFDTSKKEIDFTLKSLEKILEKLKDWYVR